MLVSFCVILVGGVPQDFLNVKNVPRLKKVGKHWCRHKKCICSFLFQVFTILFQWVLAVLRLKPTNQHAAHLYIQEHTIKGENILFFPGKLSLDVSGGIEQHPGHFQPNQCYIAYSETLRNSVKYPKNPVNHPFKMVNVISLNIWHVVYVILWITMSLRFVNHCILFFILFYPTSQFWGVL